MSKPEESQCYPGHHSVQCCPEHHLVQCYQCYLVWCSLGHPSSEPDSSKPDSSTPDSPSKPDSSKPDSSKPPIREKPGKPKWGVLVTVTLVATLSFQLGTNVPGGYWQCDEILHKKGDPVPNLPGMFYTSTVYGHRAGEAILSHKDPWRYAIIKISTSIGFSASVLTNFFLLSAARNCPHSCPHNNEQVNLRLEERLGIDVSYTSTLVSFFISEPKIPKIWALVLAVGIRVLIYVLVCIYKRK